MVNIYNIIILQILAPILLIANQLIAVHLIKLKMLKSFYYTFTISSVIMIFLLKLINLNFLLITIYFFFFLILQYLYTIIYTPQSSIRYKILSIIIKNNYKIKKSNLLKNYNNKIIFLLRLKRLLNSKTIIFKNNTVIILNKKVLLILFIFENLKQLIKIQR
jgi:hypothetical protein